MVRETPSVPARCARGHVGSAFSMVRRPYSGSALLDLVGSAAGTARGGLVGIGLKKRRDGSGMGLVLRVGKKGGLTDTHKGVCCRCPCRRRAQQPRQFFPRHTPGDIKCSRDDHGGRMINGGDGDPYDGGGGWTDNERVERQHGAASRSRYGRLWRPTAPITVPFFDASLGS